MKEVDYLEKMELDVSCLSGVYNYLAYQPEPQAQHLAVVVGEFLEATEALIEQELIEMGMRP